jgi:GNAT superfamily N-acetyltransferase
MSNEIVVAFDETLFRLPSCLTVHAQLRSNLSKFTSEDYVQYIQQLNQPHICGIIRKTESETIVLALAVYRTFLTTYDTIRFEIDDLIVDEKERNRGLGTRLLHYVIEQAKQGGVLRILVHCDLTNTDAHRFFFRLGLTVFLFEFYVKNNQLLQSNDQIRVIDITDLPEKENEQLLIAAHDIFRQLRPHLPTDQKAYIHQIRDICRTGPARMIVAINNDENKEILGLAVYRATSNIKYSKHIYCDDLVTNENKRSSGVGRCLINYMKNEGEKLGIDQLILDSGCQRGRAHKFYHREGFNINHFGFTIPF